MARRGRPGKRVLIVDEGGNWKGCGTAWKLAEDGHQVTLVTPDPLVGKELQRTAAGLSAAPTAQETRRAVSYSNPRSHVGLVKAQKCCPSLMAVRS
jgi:glycine/D-amino acid oxidase-like deaminating enzyme